MEYIRTPAQAEENAAAQMRALGYKDAVAVPAGPDGGIDVRSSRAVGQVKFRGASVSRPELQNLYGARGLDHAKELWFFAASGYTAGAIACANELQILLFTYEPHGDLKPVNDHARQKLKLIADQRVAAAAETQRLERQRVARQEQAAREAAAAKVAREESIKANDAAVIAHNEVLKARLAAGSDRPVRSMRVGPNMASTAALIKAQRAQDEFERSRMQNKTAEANVGPGIMAILFCSFTGWLGWVCFEHRSDNDILWISLVILGLITFLLLAIAASFFTRAVRQDKRPADYPTLNT